MAVPSPSILKSLVDRPSTPNAALGHHHHHLLIIIIIVIIIIINIPGYRVEVKSHLPDAVEGDYFLGNTSIIVIIISIITSFRLGYVKSVNSKNANVVISFDHDDDDDGQSSDLVIVILILILIP